jgi:hypothetical protein
LKQTVDENIAEFFDNDRLSRSVTDVVDGDKPVELPAEKPEEKVEENQPQSWKKRQQPTAASTLALVDPAAKPIEKEQPAPEPARGLSDDDIEAVADRIAERTQRTEKPSAEQPKDPFVGFDGPERDQLQAVDFLSKKRCPLQRSRSR